MSNDTPRYQTISRLADLSNTTVGYQKQDLEREAVECFRALAAAEEQLREAREIISSDAAHHYENCKCVVDAYQTAYDDFAGPRQFRHSVNHDTYHRAGLIGVWNAARKEKQP